MAINQDIEGITFNKKKSILYFQYYERNSKRDLLPGSFSSHIFVHDYPNSPICLQSSKTICKSSRLNSHKNLNNLMTS